MARPRKPPVLEARQPRTVLGWTMQQTRRAHAWSVTSVAGGYGCSASHISRVEHGLNRPSRELVQFYEDTFGCDGLLLSLYEVVAYHAEQERRRAGGKRAERAEAAPGDASAFVDDTVPHGTRMRPGELFTKTWRIRNSGTVPWTGRRLERQGPLAGPGLIVSPRYVPVAHAEPDEIVEVSVELKAPSYDCSSIAYFKMVDGEGRLCFPGSYQLGLDVLVHVREATTDSG